MTVSRYIPSDVFEDYEAGYCRPPKGHQIKKGERKNTKGRPRGSKNRKTIISEVAREMHTIKDGGKKKRVSTLELVLMFIRSQALEGKLKAIREVDRLVEQYSPSEAEEGGGVLLVPETLTPEEFIEREVAKGAIIAEG